jgi:hypothetical protein
MVRSVLTIAAVAVATSACASGPRGTAVSTLPGTVPSTPAERAIAQVKADAPGFDLFPQRAVRLGCRIPGPGVAMSIKGTCESRVTFRKSPREAIVTFTEFWPAAKFRTHASLTGTLHHSWRYAVRQDGRVRPLLGSGYFPPQAADVMHA